MGKWVVSVENDISGRESHYSEEISNPKKSVFGGISTSLKEGLESSTCLAKMKFIGSETLL